MGVKKSRIVYLSLIIILFSSLFIRFYKIQADPDTTITLSSAFYTDEGFHLTNAIKKHLTGEWKCDQRNHMALMPVMSIISYQIFQIFGISLTSIRVPSGVLVIVTVIALLLFVLKSYYKRKVHLLYIITMSLFILSTNYYLFIYSRVAFLDLPMFAFGFLSLFFYYCALSYSNVWGKLGCYFVAGLLLAISILTKTTGVFLYLTLIIIYAFLLIDSRNNNKSIEKINNIGFIISIIVSVIIVYIAFSFLDSKLGFSMEETKTSLITEKYSQNDFSLFQILKNYLSFVIIPVILKNLLYLILASISSFIIIRNFILKRYIKLIDIFFISILISIFIFFGYQLHQPSRYMVFIIVPISYLVAILPLNFTSLNFRSTISKKIIYVVIILIVSLNILNMIKIINYYDNIDYTIYELSEKVQNTINEEIEKDDEYVVYGMYTSLLAIIDVNKHNICYEIPNEITNYKYFGMKTLKLDKEENVDKDIVIIGKYNVLKNYNDNQLILFRKLSKKF